jgi:hypothetical protein
MLRFNGTTRQLVDDYYDAIPQDVTEISSDPPKYRMKFSYPLPGTSVGDFVVVGARKRYVELMCVCVCARLCVCERELHWLPPLRR